MISYAGVVDIIHNIGSCRIDSGQPDDKTGEGSGDSYVSTHAYFLRKETKMQFSSDIEECIRNKWAIRKYHGMRRLDILMFLRCFRANWHLMRKEMFPKSKEWCERRL